MAIDGLRVPLGAPVPPGGLPDALGSPCREPGEADARPPGQRPRHGLCRAGAGTPAAPPSWGHVRPPLLGPSDGAVRPAAPRYRTEPPALLARAVGRPRRRLH